MVKANENHIHFMKPLQMATRANSRLSQLLPKKQINVLATRQWADNLLVCCISFNVCAKKLKSC